MCQGCSSPAKEVPKGRGRFAREWCAEMYIRRLTCQSFQRAYILISSVALGNRRHPSKLENGFSRRWVRLESKWKEKGWQCEDLPMAEGQTDSTKRERGTRDRARQTFALAWSVTGRKSCGEIKLICWRSLRKSGYGVSFERKYKQELRRVADTNLRLTLRDRQSMTNDRHLRALNCIF